ncbi:MAG: hypothetical protein NTW49_15020, partial [Bacteroidia bacterium]|nr:hypothetical protein [Bacteroidia bacterium]
MLLRYQNKALITESTIRGTYGSDDDGEYYSENTREAGKNQLDRIIVQVRSSEDIVPATELLERL